MQAQVLYRLVGCWAGSLLLFAAVALALGQLDSFLVVIITALFSLPLLAIAVLIAVPFAHSVVDHPELWSMAAVAISTV